VRELVLQLLRKTKDAGLGDGDDAPASSVATPAIGLAAALADVRAAATAFREAAERIRP
jgi:hypothetical protein